MPDLFPYQVEGAAFLAGRQRAALFDEPGLGKTPQAIQAVVQSGARTALVICPASLVENWKREIAKFAPDYDCDWLIRSYDKITRNISDYLHDGAKWGAVVIDEGHALKTRTSKRTQAIFGPKCDGSGGLVERAEHVMILTGTPQPNNPSELWPMLRSLFPETIVNEKTGKPMAFWTFANAFCKVQQNYLGHQQIIGGKNLGKLKERIAPVYLRRKKADVLKDLPPLTVDVLALEGKIKLPAAVTEEFQMVEQALTERGIEGLKEIAPHVATLRRLTGMAKVAPVVEWVKDQLEGGLDKLVIFAYHKEVISALFDGLSPHLKVDAAVISGSTPQPQRQDMVDRFQNWPECQVFLGQISAAGTGITLTAASQMLIVESDWTPANVEQAMMRINRIGQKNACLARFATLAGSIDEQIQRALARKVEDIKTLFG